MQYAHLHELLNNVEGADIISGNRPGSPKPMPATTAAARDAKVVEKHQPVARAVARPAKKTLSQPATGAANGNGATNDPNRNNANMTSVNQNQPVICPTTGRVYPASSRFDYESLLSDTKPFGRVPWFDRSAIERRHIVPRYTVNGSLASGITVEVTTTWA